ncbi:MAG: hypothetical protein ACK52U_09425 [Synechococcaceae cyanobacterium]|jgi:hypothetical protein
MPDEFDILAVFVETLEANGLKPSCVQLPVDDEFVARLNTKHQASMSRDEVHRLVDKCLANEWLERNTHSKYLSLSITSAGAGVVRSRIKSAEARRNRTVLKKLSDTIDDHKGLFLALGAILGLLSLAARLFLP